MGKKNVTACRGSEEFVSQKRNLPRLEVNKLSTESHDGSTMLAELCRCTLSKVTTAVVQY